MKTIQEIDTALAKLRAEVTALAAQIARAPKKSEARENLVREQQCVIQDIGALKQQRHELASTSDPALPGKAYVLWFPKENRVRHYADNLSPVELMMMLEEVFEPDDRPALMSTYNIEPELRDQIPESWRELE